MKFHHILIVFCILCFATICDAQQTAPISYDLSYRFTPGEKLHYRYFAKYDAIDSSNEKGHRFVSSGRERELDIVIAVEQVDSSGNITMTINEHGVVTNSIESSPSMTDLNEQVRVVIDKYGQYINGNSIKLPEHLTSAREGLEKTGAVGNVIPDSEKIKHLILKVLPTYPQRPLCTEGEYVVNASLYPRTIPRYTINSPRGAKLYTTPTVQTLSIINLGMDSLMPIRREIYRGEKCIKIVKRRMFGENLPERMRKFYSIHTIYIRESDGAIVEQTATNDPTYKTIMAQHFTESLILQKK